MEEIKRFLKDLEQNGEHSASTLQSYSNDLRRFEAFLKNGNNRDLSSVTISIDKLEKFLDSEFELGYKPSTLHRRKVALTQFAEYLVELKVLDEREMHKIRTWEQDIWSKINQRKIKCLNELEIKELENTILREKTARVFRDISIISLFLETALSIKPIIEINLSDLDIRANRVSVFNGVKRLWYSIPKSKVYLESYLTSSRPELTQSVNEEALFVSQMGGRITRQGVWQIVRGWGIKANLSVALSPRILRHTSVVRMLKFGMSVTQIQTLLGHSNLLSTQALIRKLSKNISLEKEKEVEI